MKISSVNPPVFTGDTKKTKESYIGTIAGFLGCTGSYFYYLQDANKKVPKLKNISKTWAYVISGAILLAGTIVDGIINYKRVKQQAEQDLKQENPNQPITK